MFAVRLEDAADLDAVRDDLAGAVHQAREPAPGTGVDQPARLCLASAGSAAVKPGPVAGCGCRT